jgi:hypothetical protein
MATSTYGVFVGVLEVQNFFLLLYACASRTTEVILGTRALSKKKSFAVHPRTASCVASTPPTLSAHVRAPLAHVASLVVGWPTTPSVSATRRVANVAITNDGEPFTRWDAHERESFTLGEHSRIGTWKKVVAREATGNANRVRQSFFRKKHIGVPHAD